MALQNVSIFNGLHSLAYLNLGHCSIRNLKPAIFNSDLAKCLKFLRLNHNPLQILREKQFSSLTSLACLDLTECKIKSIASTFASELHSLQKLYIFDNSFVFDKLPQYAFSLDIFYDYAQLDESRVEIIAQQPLDESEFENFVNAQLFK